MFCLLTWSLPFDAESLQWGAVAVLLCFVSSISFYLIACRVLNKAKVIQQSTSSSSSSVSCSRSCCTSPPEASRLRTVSGACSNPTSSLYSTCCGSTTNPRITSIQIERNFWRLPSPHVLLSEFRRTAVEQETIKKKNQRQVCLTHEGDVFQLNIEQPANLRCLLIDKLRAEELVDGESDVAGSCETENNNAGERGARAVAVDISNCIPTTTTTTGLKLDKRKKKADLK